MSAFILGRLDTRSGGGRHAPERPGSKGGPAAATVAVGAHVHRRYTH
jgi:hypothetical protein